MNASPEYLLRWRGRPRGPCTLNEINRLLDEHEIGLGHEIQSQNGWITLEEFLKSLKSEAKGPQPMTGQPLVQPASNQPGAGHRPSSNPQNAFGSTDPAGSAPPARPPSATKSEAPAPAAVLAVRPRRRIVYAVLAILLGFSGLHNFYARHWLTGVIQFLVSCVSFLLGFGIIVPWLWALVEAVVVHKDGHELNMS